MICCCFSNHETILYLSRSYPSYSDNVSQALGQAPGDLFFQFVEKNRDQTGGLMIN